MRPVQIFIGYDHEESIAYHVLAHSIITRSSIPVSITPIGTEVPTGRMFWRGREPHDSTQFSNARFLAPHLAGYDDDICIFMDCDMLCLGDIADLVEEARMISDPWSVMVKPHKYKPSATKFLDQANADYGRKNWSSLMVFNLKAPAVRNLTPAYVNDEPGLNMHKFGWCPDSHIAFIAGNWNMLVGYQSWQGAQLVHFTDGGPWHGIRDGKYSELWSEELCAMLEGANPRADATYVNLGAQLKVSAEFIE